MNVDPKALSQVANAMVGLESPASKTTRRSYVPSLVALLLAAVIVAGAHFGLNDPMLARATMLAGICLVLWLFEVIPLYATTLVL